MVKQRLLILLFLMATFGLLRSQDTITVQYYWEFSDTSGNFLETLNDNDYFGTIASIGDLNGDGVTDLAVGAVRDDDGGTDHGAVYIMFMGADGNVDSTQKISDTQGNFTATLGYDNKLGSDIIPLGDVNGDSIPDIAVGAFGDADGGTRTGAVFILFLDSDGTVKSYSKISDSSGMGGALNSLDNFGASLGTWDDFNGNGLPELLVWSAGDDDGGTNKGAFWIIYYDSTGTVDSTQKISDLYGGFEDNLPTYGNFGAGAMGIGDLNQDGIVDIAAGAVNVDDGGTDRGACWVLFMNSTGTVGSYQRISDTIGDFGATMADGDKFGGIGAAGDYNGDGITDLIVSSHGLDDGATDAGGFYILIMGTDGKVDAEYKISATSGNLNANLGAGNFFANSRHGVGDFNGDNKLDVLIAHTNDDDGGTNRGSCYIITLNSYDHSSHVALMKRKLDAGYYLAKGELLKFKYEEDYFYDDPTTMVYNIYDKQHDKVSSLPSETIVKGDNRFEIDLSAISGMATGEYYTLEVVNAKNEKRYLRFYNQSKSAGSWIANPMFQTN